MAWPAGKSRARVDGVRRVALVIRTAATIGNYGVTISPDASRILKSTLPAHIAPYGVFSGQVI